MKRFPAIAVVCLLLCFAVFAVDYTVDPGFVPPAFEGTVGSPRCGPAVGAVHVQPDGKMVVGGSFTLVDGQTAKYLVRLNPDGTRDMSFTSILSWASTGAQWSCVNRIRPLPDGDMMVIGEFSVGGKDAYYVRINPDGTRDNTLSQLQDNGRDIVQLSNGQYIVCGLGFINNETYWVAHRINADGSPDPTFRITGAQASCRRIELVEGGKLLMSVSGYIPNQPLLRFNPDGSYDPTFQVQYAGGGASDADMALYPDGNMLVSYSTAAGRYVQKLGPNGQLLMTIPYCYGEALLPEADGSAIVSTCRKFVNGWNYEFADILPDGRLSPDMDPLPFNDPHRSVAGFADAGNGKYYVFGEFGSIEGIQRFGLARLMPRAPIPFKARHDFDGDGRTDYTVWRKNGDRIWYINQSTAGFRYFQFGLPTDIPVAADYDRDGKTDVAVWRDGLWYLGLDSGLTFKFLGRPGDKPLITFQSGANFPYVLVRRPESDSTITWRSEITGGIFYDGFLIGSIPGELSTDLPVFGDFDGDSMEELGYFQDGLWVTRYLHDGATLKTFDWGQAGDIPVPADYDGDAKTDYAIYRPSTGDWWINNSGSEPTVVRWGISTDIPVPADYDGDGRADISIFRDGQWWHILSSTGTPAVVNWGIAGDVPIPAQHR